MARLTRAEYAARHGPTTGDRIRLADTNLFARVERDKTSYGDKLLRWLGEDLAHGDHPGPVHRRARARSS